MEAQMDEQERGHFTHEIRELERSSHRWKLATCILAAALSIFLIVNVASSIPMVQIARERNEAMRQLEQARAAEAARLQAEKMALMERRAAQWAENKPKLQPLSP
jgi:hypothetical protein